MSLHDEMSKGTWCEQNPYRCECRGSGWVLSDWDIAYQCCYHGAGVPNPYDEDGHDEHGDFFRWTKDHLGNKILETFTFDSQQHRLQMARQAYKAFQIESKLTPQNFEITCRHLFHQWQNLNLQPALENPQKPTPQDWCFCAEYAVQQLQFYSKD